MGIEYHIIDVPAKKVRRGGKVLTLPAHRAVRVDPPHTIFQLARRQRKEARAERQAGYSIVKSIKRGKMVIDKDGDVSRPDPFGVMPPTKIGVSGRIMDMLRKKFGFY